VADHHVPDYLILPFGRAVKADLQRITLSAVSANGLYFSTEVPVIFINKSEERPLCLSDFDVHFGQPIDDWNKVSQIEQMESAGLYEADDRVILEKMCDILKTHNPNMTPSEEQFLDYYFGVLKSFQLLNSGKWQDLMSLAETIGLDAEWVNNNGHKSKDDLWRALIPIPELQLYVHDPLSEAWTYEPRNNFRVDYGFWNGQQLIAVELDGAEPEGYARDIRRDRLLRRAGVDVIHILNVELARHKARALANLLPLQFFGHNWNYEGERPNILPCLVR
jgi:hypothetical protein